jgi:fumarylacetoacetate (FAA) hydrolase family protein
VLGTDFPFDMGTTEPVSLFGAPLADDVRQRILSGHSALLLRHAQDESSLIKDPDAPCTIHPL